MLSRLLASLFGLRFPQRRSRARQLAARRAFLQTLEDRRLLAVQSLQAFDDVAPVVGAFTATTVTNDNRLAIAVNTPHPSALTDISILNDDGSETAVQNLENVPTDANGVAHFTTIALADGPYLIRARAGVYAKYFSICAPALTDFQAEGTLNFRVDTARPAPIASPTIAGPTNSTDPLPFRVTFSEPVTGFQAADAIVTNGTISRFTANSPTTYTLLVRPTASGDVSLRIPASRAIDAASNANTASNTATIRFDRVPPALDSITRKAAGSGLTNADSISFRATFSEPVTGVGASDFSVVGSTARITSVTQVSPSVYDVTLRGGDLPGLNGPVKLALKQGQNITDLAGNSLPTRRPAVDQSYILDNTRPTAEITTTVRGPTNAASIPITVKFTEPVVGFTLRDIVLSNATASSFTGSGASYTLNVAPRGDGIITIGIPAGAAVDAVGNKNIAAPAVSIVSDRTPPRAVLSSSAPNPSSAATIPFQVVFSEPVDGFTAADIAVVNGSVVGISGNGTSFTFTVAPTADGIVTVRVPASVAQDAALNDNRGSNAVSIRSDSTAPTVTLASTSPDPTNADSIPFRVAFRQSVTGFVAADLEVSNGSVSGFAGAGDSYTFNVSPIADGPVIVRVPAAVAQDLAGNDNTASGTVTIVSDRTLPAVVLSSTAISPSNAASFPVRATFTEAVRGFTADDVVLTNGTISGFSGSGALYTFNVTPLSDGVVTIGIPGSAAQDAAANDNTRAASLFIRSDRTSPATTLFSPSPSPTNADSIPFHVTFTQAVTGFTADDVIIANGRMAGFAGSGSTYTFRVIPAADGTVTVNVPGLVAMDAAGNGNLAALPLSIISDRTAPAAVISTNATSPTNAASLPIRIGFSEAVSGFTAADVVITNGTIADFTGSGASYTFSVTPAADGVVTVGLPAAAAQDAAGNDNSAAATVSIRSDRTRPSAMVATTATSPTNASSLSYRVTFSETVTGFAIGDVAVVNGTISGFVGSGRSYSFRVAPAVDGPVTVNIPSASASDAADNDNTASATLSITSDRTPPTTLLTTTATNPSNAASFFYNVTFSESVTGFAAGDLAVVNGSVSNFVGSGASYSFRVAPTADGVVTVGIPAGAASDAAGNDNTAAAPLSITSNRLTPGVVLTTLATSPTNLASIFYRVTFSQPVTGFAIGDLAVINGTASSFAGSGANYSFRIAPTADGVVTVTVPAAIANNAAGKANTASAPLSITSDRTQPTTILTTTAANPTNLAAIAYRVVFSEPVTGFAAGDVALSNGTISGFAGSGRIYTFNVSPAAEGAVTVRVPAAIAFDPANNSNRASAPLVVVSDQTAPTTLITSRLRGPTNAALLPVQVDFSEPVTGFRLSDIVVGNGVASGFAGGGRTYTFNIAPAADGAVTVNVPSAVARDAAKNDNLAAAPLSILSDRTKPGALIASVLASPTNAAVIPVSVTFSEPVAGFTLADLNIANGTPSNLKGAGDTYTFDVTPVTDGLVTINLPAAAAQDAAGNDNTAAIPLSIVSDRKAPGVVLATVLRSPTNASTIPFTVTFDEPVTGFTLADLVVTNGGVANLAGSGANYTFDLKPIADGLVTVRVPPKVAQDAAGNDNTPSATVSLTSDRTRPDVVIMTAAVSPTNAAVISYTVSFTEPVTGFALSDIVANGTLSNFAGAGADYTFDVTPTADGTVTVSIPANVAQDSAGNDNTPAPPVSVVSDRTRPGTVISTQIASPTNAATIPFKVTFDEPVTGFTLADIVPNNGVASNLQGSGAVYTFDITPSGDGIVTVDVPAAVAQDAAGNDNTAAAQATITSDRTAPGVVVGSPAASPTNANTIPFTIGFSEPVNGFVQGDLTITNGTIIDFSGPAGGANYTVNVAPNGNGPVRVTVPAGVAQDAAGNNNSGGTFAVTSDRAAPTAVLAYTVPGPGANLGMVAVTFNEPVTGVSIDDFTLLFNGNPVPLTPGMLSGGGANYTIDLSTLPRGSGNYQMTLTAAGSGIFDQAGNAMQANASTTWVH